MEMIRLQGREAGPADNLWLGVSTIEPGGGTTLDASASEKFYVVLTGEVIVSNGSEEVALHRWDSCRFAPGESRALRNGSSEAAMILLAMPLSPSPAAPPKT
ncbi:cupin domain-containing protein [Ensifer adhaerens]|uniref:cupin domain-containing protein n=2 Tax=Ensifer adhaerens TaxID=106592 RepID=UPI002E2927B6|nr:cupin domain-containing protein [Ensifer adhaerens]